MQCSRMTGGTGGGADVCLIEQDEHARSVNAGKAQGTGGVQAMLRAAMNAHVWQRGMDEVLKAVAHGMDAGLGAVIKVLPCQFRRSAESEASNWAICCRLPSESWTA